MEKEKKIKEEFLSFVSNVTPIKKFKKIQKGKSLFQKRKK